MSVRTCFVTKLERARKLRQPPETTDMPVCAAELELCLCS